MPYQHQSDILSPKEKLMTLIISVKNNRNLAKLGESGFNREMPVDPGFEG